MFYVGIINEGFNGLFGKQEIGTREKLKRAVL